MQYKDYTMINQLGEGGNAKVFLVEDLSHNKYAIKELVNKTREKKQRFLNEISIMQKWSSKINGIIPLYDCSETEFWYTMPIAEPVIKYIETNTPSLNQIIDYYIGLCHTMSELHRNEVTHRDIKPDNIYYYNNRFYIGDFGLVDFPDNDNNLTRSDRGIGAIFTIAPEMKRDPKHADGKKADVYSLAKTLWMLLSLDDKGFDGQYNYFDSIHALNRFPQLSKSHIIEIEELIRDSTSNNPDDRPTIDDFIKRLELWKSVISDFSKQQKSQWTSLYKHILNKSGESVVWRNNSEIIEILNKISALNAYNHMFYPDGGGQDFRFAKNSPEENGIEIWDDNNTCNIVFPKALHFEAFPSNDEWNYFVLELKDKDNIFESDFCYEELVEDIPAHYVVPTYYQYGVYDYDKGNSFPAGYRLVARYTRGKILFVLKNGPYNCISGTYDARHNLCSCEKFREYISALIVESHKYKNRDSFFDSRIANYNPFIESYAAKEKRTTGFDKLMERLSISPQVYLKTKFDFSDIKEVTNDEYAKYYISFHPNNGTINFNSKKILLCKDGYLHELDNELENVLYFNSREFAHKVKELCNQQLLPHTGEIVLSYFTVNIFGLLKPVHLFSKNEIEHVMREADDRKHNTLVIDEHGYPRIIGNNELDVQSFPVHHERWNAGNLYVGKYSNLSILDEAYISSLQGWLLYLQTNSSKYVDYLSDNQDESKLIAEINAL